MKSEADWVARRTAISRLVDGGLSVGAAEADVAAAIESGRVRLSARLLGHRGRITANSLSIFPIGALIQGMRLSFADLTAWLPPHERRSRTNKDVNAEEQCLKWLRDMPAEPRPVKPQLWETATTRFSSRLSDMRQHSKDHGRKWHVRKAGTSRGDRKRIRIAIKTLIVFRFI